MLSPFTVLLVMVRIEWHGYMQICPVGNFYKVAARPRDAHVDL